MGPTETSRPADAAASESERVLPAFVDWILAALIAVGGLALTVGGAALTFVVDRAMLAEGVESGEITILVFERDLTEAEMLDLTQEVVNWTGIGLLVTGAGLALFAVGYAVTRHRAHRRVPDEEPASSDRAHAVLGAVVTALLSFIPFSAVAGGAVAGYFEHDDTGRSVSVGALSGVLATVPAIAITAFVTVGLYAGLAAVGESGLGIVTAAAMLLGLLFTAAFGAGLGAVGGFAGGRLAERDP